jgi:hypothetical protein
VIPEKSGRDEEIKENMKDYCCDDDKHGAGGEGVGVSHI